MQQSPQRKSIQVYYALDCRIPYPDLKAWILVYVSFNDPTQYTASAFRYAEMESDKLPFGQHVINADGTTPFEAVKALTEMVDKYKPDNIASQDDIEQIKDAIDVGHIFTPTIPFNEIEKITMPLPRLILVHPDVKTLLMQDSLITAQLASKITCVPEDEIEKLLADYRDNNNLYRLDNVLCVMKSRN